MRFFCFLTVFILLSGCTVSQEKQTASFEKYQEILNNWLGKEKEDLFEVWGNPSYSYQKKGLEYVVYIKNKLKQVANGNQIERMPRIAKEKSFFKEETATVSKGCTTIFILEDDYIRQWRFEGSGCQAY